MPKKSTKPLILVDGSSYLYRAFHIPNLQDLHNSEGMPTGAIRGVISMLKRLQGNENPSHMAVIFDAKGKTFRHDLYKEYKANRPPMPDELQIQIEPLYDVVRALGLPLICEPGVEADDVIGTLANRAVEQGLEVLVSTGDKDMAQLVNEQVTLVNTMTDTKMDTQGVIDKFGVGPHQIIEYLALMGDKSDNIPGVPSVGPKTAAKWLNEYETLDQLINNADAIKGKVGEKFRAHLEQLPMSVELTTIRCDIELEQSIEDLVIQAEDHKQLSKLYRQLEFKTWLKKLEEEGVLSEEDSENDNDAANIVDENSKIEAKYEVILTKKDLDRWLKRLQKADLVAFDTETDSLDYMQANVVGLSFAVQPGEAAYVPLMHNYPGVPKQLDRAEVLAKLTPILNAKKAKIIGHNLKYDRSVLLNHDIELNSIQHDTMLESYVCNSIASRHDLDTLCEKYLSHSNIHFEDVAGKGAKQITFDQVELEQAVEYAAEDADMVLRLHKVFWSELEQKAKQKQKDLYQNIELPMLKVLSNVERNGVLVDDKLLAKQSKQLGKRIVEVEKEAYELAGSKFNLASPKQIQEILFEQQGLPVVRKTPKGQPSTAEDVLQELAEQYPLPKLLLEHRTLSKLKSTYLDKLPLLINPKTGRIHTSYHQAVAVTGRLSSSDPNLQNIPIRTEEGRRIRQAFIAEKDKKILAADYSQIELRIMAHLSQDKRLCEAFAQGEDIHRATAAEVFDLELGDVAAEQRRAAKAINFGLIYGMSAFGLAKQLGISRTEAQQYVTLYFERYPGVKKYMDNIREQAREESYVETLFGRRLYLPDINNKNVQRRQYAERTAINAPMQGTAADIIKRAMLDIDASLQEQDLNCRMIMQVHDELVFEVHEDCVKEIQTIVVEKMTNAAELSVPLVVDAQLGSNWDEAH